MAYTRDYITTARAKGLRPGTVLRRHGFRNVLVPVIAVIGLDVGYLPGGAVLGEIVCADDVTLAFPFPRVTYSPTRKRESRS